jgi:hypothetical protein
MKRRIRRRFLWRDVPPSARRERLVEETPRHDPHDSADGEGGDDSAHDPRELGPRAHGMTSRG